MIFGREVDSALEPAWKKNKNKKNIDTGEVGLRVIECEVVVRLTGLLMSLRYPWPGELAAWGESDPTRRAVTRRASRIGHSTVYNSTTLRCIAQLVQVPGPKIAQLPLPTGRG